MLGLRLSQTQLDCRILLVEQQHLLVRSWCCGLAVASATSVVVVGLTSLSYEWGIRKEPSAVILAIEKNSQGRKTYRAAWV